MQTSSAYSTARRKWGGKWSPPGQRFFILPLIALSEKKAFQLWMIYTALTNNTRHTGTNTIMYFIYLKKKHSEAETFGQSECFSLFQVYWIFFIFKDCVWNHYNLTNAPPWLQFPRVVGVRGMHASLHACVGFLIRCYNWASNFWYKAGCSRCALSLLPDDSWDRLQPPASSNKIKKRSKKLIVGWESFVNRNSTERQLRIVLLTRDK